MYRKFGSFAIFVVIDNNKMFGWRFVGLKGLFNPVLAVEVEPQKLLEDNFVFTTFFLEF